MSGWYDEGLRQFALGNVSWKKNGSDIRAQLVDAGFYTVDLTKHSWLSDIPDNARVGSAVKLALIDAEPGGILDAQDVIFRDTALKSNKICNAVVIYKHVGIERRSPLLMYLDGTTGKVIGLPVPSGVDRVNVFWNNDENKIARL